MLKCCPSISLDSFWDDLINRLVQLKIERNQVVYGSMPANTLFSLSQLLTGNGLQVGGFVGVAHCYLSLALMGKGSICTVDPNLSHRGINNPLLIASQLVSYFNLSKNSMLICGYSEDQMRLFDLMGAKFDFVILDGNHDYFTVMRELFLVDKILKPGGYLVLDDIDHWSGPKKVYNELSAGYNRIELDKRVGLLQKIYE